MIGRARGPECSSTSFQSTAFPSEIDSATDRRRVSSSLPLMCHLLGEFDEGAADGHVYGSHARFLEHVLDLFVRQAHLDARDDQLPLLRPQVIERRVVACERLAPD